MKGKVLKKNAFKKTDFSSGLIWGYYKQQWVIMITKMRKNTLTVSFENNCVKRLFTHILHSVDIQNGF